MHVMPFRPWQRSSGFSLIELLVVITVISILAAMTMTAVGLVRSGAYRVSCGKNLGQMALGIVAYATENDGIIPVCRFDFWHGQEMPLIVAAHYLVEKTSSNTNDLRNVLVCPADRRQHGSPGAGTWGGLQSRGAIWSSSSGDPYGTDFISIDSSYSYRAQTFDANWTKSNEQAIGLPNPVAISTVKSTKALYWDAPRTRDDSLMGYNLHGTGVNMSFIDGRAAWFNFFPAKHLEIWVQSWTPGEDHYAQSSGEVVRYLGPGVCAPFNNMSGEPWN